MVAVGCILTIASVPMFAYGMYLAAHGDPYNSHTYTFVGAVLVSVGIVVLMFSL